MSSYTDPTHRAKQNGLGVAIVALCAVLLPFSELSRSTQLFCLTAFMLVGTRLTVEAFGEILNSREGDYHRRRAIMYAAVLVLHAVILIIAFPIVNPVYHVPLVVCLIYQAIRPVIKIYDHLLCLWRARREEDVLHAASRGYTHVGGQHAAE